MTIIFNDSRIKQAEWTGKLVDEYEEGKFPKDSSPGHYNKQAAIKQKFILEGPGDMTVTFNDGSKKLYKDVHGSEWRKLANKGSGYFFSSIQGNYQESALE